jgi:myo-inositol-1(or 4)-monophosphatase
MSGRAADLERIRTALAAAGEVLRRHAQGAVAYELKDDHGPVTAADREVDALLRSLLPLPGDGWLSEESEDDPARLRCRRVWVVDPIDGTRSFIARRPEYAISIALVEDGVPVLGGIANPAAGVSVLGGPGSGVHVEGDAAQAFGEHAPGALRVLCSRSEWQRGEWRRWQGRADVATLPVGSVAYKLALVAAGAADATWTLRGKHEWDVAAGAALVRAAGGTVWLPHDGEPHFNQRHPRFSGFAAASATAVERVRALLRA